MRYGIVLFVAACYQHAPYAGDGASGDGHADAAGDGTADAAAGTQVCSAHIAQACVGPPQSGITLSDPIDTTLCTNGTLIDSDLYCLIAADSITVLTHVHVKGSRPLVLAATTIDISDHLDASSEVGGARVGAGSGRICPAGTQLPTAASGGAGGSFGTPGGNGGTGGSNGTGGIAEPAFVSIVTGGCPGQRGANAPIASAGPGGGALWIFAGQQLMITGTVEANGGGGEGGSASAVGGGGGGGSGGLIGLESPSIVVTGAMLAANGGGGGGGSVAGFAGGNGNDGAFTSAALGGSGQMKTEIGGNGGNGAFMGNTVTSGTSGTTGGGGGGGGGGEGYIYRYGMTSGTPAVVSPPWQP